MLANKSKYLTMVFVAVLLFQVATVGNGEGLEEGDNILDFSSLLGAYPFAGYRPVTVTEYKALEPYCKLILSNYLRGNTFWFDYTKTFPVFQRPEFRMGHGSSWAHHYCHGKVHKYRYFAAFDKQTRDSALGIWNSQMHYSLDQANRYTKNYAYKFDILTELAETEYYMGELSESVIHATKAIKENNKHIRAYRVLADSYIKMKEPDKALSVVNEGLNIIPDAKSLLLLHSELTGKPANKDNSSPANIPAAK
ncbi:MAG: tetratricopeptide repeat protein [Candidatus Methylumidiphilus sp.]